MIREKKERPKKGGRIITLMGRTWGFLLLYVGGEGEDTMPPRKQGKGVMGNRRSLMPGWQELTATPVLRKSHKTPIGRR